MCVHCVSGLLPPPPRLSDIKPTSTALMSYRVQRYKKLLFVRINSFTGKLIWRLRLSLVFSLPCEGLVWIEGIPQNGKKKKFVMSRGLRFSSQKNQHLWNYHNHITLYFVYLIKPWNSLIMCTGKVLCSFYRQRKMRPREGKRLTPGHTASW